MNTHYNMTTLTISYIRILNTQWCGITHYTLYMEWLDVETGTALKSTTSVVPPLIPFSHHFPHLLIVTDLTELWQRKDKMKLKVCTEWFQMTICTKHYSI